MFGEIVRAVGLVLVIEGVLWTVAPGLALKMLEEMATVPGETLRLFGALAVVSGLLVVYLASG
ncbi:MAG: DUF2065 domain-containing protein [Hyphomicrobiaceae bacterium]